MKLSVILPCHNGAATIAQQLDALVAQQYAGEWEMIVVNNGSTDESVAIAQQYSDRLPQFRIVDAHHPPEPLLGVTHSYNVGLQAATGDAFVFCEADDEVGPAWLASAAQGLEQADCVAGPLDHTKLNPPWLFKTFGPGTQLDELPRFYLMKELTYASGCNLGFRRAVYEALGPIDESIRYVWDTEFCWNIQLSGFTLKLVPGMLVHYRLPTSLAKIYRRSFLWCVETVDLQRRFRRPNAPFWYLRVTYWVIKNALRLAVGWITYPLVRSKGNIAKALYELGGCLGRFQGNRQYGPLPTSRKSEPAISLDERKEISAL